MVICPYCGNEAILVKGTKVYPHRKDLHGFNFWYCNNGHTPAYVGCHKTNTRLGLCGDEPLGRLANAELRSLKSQAHIVFDSMWKEGKFKSRKKAYNWLANYLGISVEDCHIGMFDEEMCRKVINGCTSKTTSV